MFTKIICSLCCLAGVLCISYAGDGNAGMTIPEEDNPDACLDGTHSGGFHSAKCGRWYVLTEIKEPDACLGGTHSGGFHSAKCGRWYGLGGPMAKVAKVEKVRVIVLKGIEFDFDKSNIRPSSLSIVEKNVDELKAYKNVDIRIVGHTDSKGSDEYNQKLSERRANAVMQYFISNGVNGDRMSASGKGESEPVALNTNADSTDNPTGRQENRRIEIHIK